MQSRKFRKIATLALVFMIVLAQSGLTFAGKIKPPPPITSNLTINETTMAFDLTENETESFTIRAYLKSPMTTSWTAKKENGETLNSPVVTYNTIVNKRTKTYVADAIFTFTPSDIAIPQSYTYTITATNPLNAIDTDTLKVTFNVTPIIDNFLYVALGDSIPSGVSYSGTTKRIITSYTDMLASYFGTLNSNFEYVDYSVSGYNTIDVVTQLDDLSKQAVIREADVITLCIGANDLMDAAIQWELFGLTYYDFYNIDWAKADAGRATFETNWPILIQKIKSLNPDVNLLVSTIYNPYNISDAMHAPVDAYMWNEDLSKLGINSIITAKAPLFNYKVVDIHKFFEENYGDNKATVTGFYDNAPFDPHPDELGQAMIYEQHLKLLQ